ncbi:MAG: hypothetical protein FWE15_19115 [Actinomycetia bacterium]|nr:hypothetical protein [Actinomycetes bacterium]MCL2732125.1 hypothetical protein [Actinomycetes bacterium]
MVDFALDYGVLHAARKDLHDLADEIGPTLKSSDYATLGEDSSGVAGDVFGNAELAAAFSTLYYRSKHPMEKAEDDLRKLGDTFGAVADGFFNIDAQIAEGAGVMGQNLGLSDWRGKHDAWLGHDTWVADNKLWQQYLANKSACEVDDGSALPDFCKATDPGPEPTDPGPPPTDQVIHTPDGGTVHTTLTLDDQYNVTTEKTTVTTGGGQTYSSTTAYKPDGRSYVTDTTYADNSTSHADVTINADGTGTMSVTDGDGNVSTYARSGPGAKWDQTSGAGMDDGSDDSSTDDYIPTAY